MKTTLKDIAEATGLSVKTVSLCMNGKPVNAETRARIEETAKRLDYHPNYMARQLAKGETDAIGFFLSIAPDRFSLDHFFIEMFEWLAQDVQRHGKTLNFIYLDDRKLTNPEILYEYTRSGRLDGAIFFGSLESNILRLMKKEKLPSVILQQEIVAPHMGCVSVDNFHGGYDAVDHLLDVGYRSVGIIGQDRNSNGISRLDGARERVRRAGLPEPVYVQTEYNDMKSGYHGMRDFLASNPKIRPESWFALTDVVALGAYRAFRENGIRIPEDVGIIGFDDARIVEFSDPPLTTMRVPKPEISSLAISKLMHMISGQITEGAKTVVNAELVVRKSCLHHN